MHSAGLAITQDSENELTKRIIKSDNPRHKVYEAHIARDEFREMFQKFLSDDDTWEIILKDKVDSPLKVDMLEKFNQKIVWQDEAKKHLTDAIISAIESVKENENWPLKTLFFAWNTWVGKTEIMRVLAEICFWSKRWITLIPCEQYGEKWSTSNIFGSSKWYIWHWETTPLNDINLFKPYRESRESKVLHEAIYKLDDFAIIVFDEIEKASEKFIQSLLNVLSSWYIEFPSWYEDKPNDYKHSKITDLKNVIIVFTSNVWTREVKKRVLWFNMWWQTHEEELKRKYERTVGIFKDEMKKHFSPEFLWRVDEVVYFNDLNEEDCRNIIRNSLSELNDAYAYIYDFRISIWISQEVENAILRDWFDKETGARKLKRVILKNIEQRINNYLVWWNIEQMLPKDKILEFLIDYAEDWFTYRISKKKIWPEHAVKKAKWVVNHIMEIRRSSVVMEAMHPNIVPIQAEVLYIQDRYRRIYSLYINEWIDIESWVKYYEIVLRELGHTDEDIAFLKQQSESDILDPKDVLETYKLKCDWSVSWTMVLSVEDEFLSNIIDSVITKYPRININRLYEKIFRTMEALTWSKLNIQEIMMLKKYLAEKNLK